MNIELLEFSIDNVDTYIAWVRKIEEKFGTKVEFSVITDLSIDIAKKYSMITPNESSTKISRVVFVIDDKQIIRAIIYYPLSTGRNMDKMVRLVKALQNSDDHQVDSATLEDNKYVVDSRVMKLFQI